MKTSYFYLLKYFYLASNFLFINFLHAQEFEVGLNISNANGLEQTLEIGYDGQATDGIDAKFGEIDIIDIPFDSLEVRLAQFSFTLNCWNSVADSEKVLLNLSYKNIISKECFEKPTREEISYHGIVVPNDILPVSISWDKEVLQLSCSNNPFFSPVTPWLFGDTPCPKLAIIDRLINMKEEDKVEIIEPTGPQILDLNARSYSVLAVYLQARDGSVVSIEDQEQSNFLAWPNPFESIIHLDGINQNLNYFIYSLEGHLVQKGSIINNQIEYNQKGIFILQIEEHPPQIIIAH